MKTVAAGLPSPLILNKLLQEWLLEDIGRGDHTTRALLPANDRHAVWIAKEAGVIAGLPIAARVFQLLDSSVAFKTLAEDGEGKRSLKSMVRLMRC